MCRSRHRVLRQTYMSDIAAAIAAPAIASVQIFSTGLANRQM